MQKKSLQIVSTALKEVTWEKDGVTWTLLQSQTQLGNEIVKHEYDFLQNRLQASDEKMQVLRHVSFEKESLLLNKLPVESWQIERDDFYGLGKEKEESFKHRKNDFDVLVDRNEELCVPYSKEKLRVKS